MQTLLKFRIVITGSLLVVLTLSTVTTVVRIPATMTPGNHTGISAGSGAGNMTFVGNMTGGRSMMMPGGNMTFGASLQNAKMHLTEAIMDLKTGNTRGAMMELNLTDQGIKMHEQEMKSMMMELKNVMAHER
ncbi:MAG: hypothetical protein WAJ93_24975 [Candidatus Nitrosopolaris sp.]